MQPEALVNISAKPPFRDAPTGTGPESMRPVVVIDSGLIASRCPGMTAEIVDTQHNN
jgi:hypothetical protein